MGRKHSFGKSLKVGALGETVLDVFFGAAFDIEPVDMTAQRRGIDRVFTRDGYEPLAVEYKTDTQGHSTGNVFLETVSGDRTGKPGWVYTTESDALVYYLHEDGGGSGYIVDPDDLRNQILGWAGRFPVKTARNRTYCSYGVLVPAKVFGTIARNRFDVSEGSLDGFLDIEVSTS